MWSCSICGPHPNSSSMWCEKGCGRDYNRMDKIMDNDHMELGETGLIPQANGWFYNVTTNKYISPEGKECNPKDFEGDTKDS